MYVGAIYGGSRSAILLNIPGTPANAATSLDGYPLARAGQAGRAMGIATTGSVIGSLIGIAFLATVAPVLAEFALRFGAYEFFWLAVFGVVISGNLTALDDPLKGWIAGFLGLAIAMVGQEGIHAYARFAYGSTDLAGGIGLLPALVGAFGFAEVLIVMKQRAPEIIRSATFDHWLRKLRDVGARARIQARIDRFAMGNPGDVEPVGEGVSELRIDYGPGYRVYFLSRGRMLVVLLCGGDKSSQRRDIARAKEIAREWRE
jgi:putative tricarboxylic transport membrane protein